MDVPKIPGDVLAQPTRARLFARLGELRRAASTDELAKELGLHRNGVRMHLDRLEDAGLVVRERERRPQGRPRDAWSINPDAQPGGDPPTAYADLGRWLVRSISAGKTRVRDVESAGREIGRELAAQAPASTAEGMRDVLGAMGFQPTSKVDRTRTLTYTLANCPYRDVVRENQPVVCALLGSGQPHSTGFSDSAIRAFSARFLLYLAVSLMMVTIGAGTPDTAKPPSESIATINADVVLEWFTAPGGAV